MRGVCARKMGMINAPKIYKMRIEFTVCAAADNKRIFGALRNAVLKSGLAFEPAKINKNWPRLAYGPVLGYGLESLGEFADIYLLQSVPPQEVHQALSRAAGPLIAIKRVERVPYALPSVANLAQAARYIIEGDFSPWAPKQSLTDFLNGRQATAVLTAPNAAMTQEVPLSPYVVKCEQPEENKYFLTLQTVNDKTLKPQYALAAWLGIPIVQGEEFTIPGVRFIREGLFWRDSQGGLHRI